MVACLSKMISCECWWDESRLMVLTGVKEKHQPLPKSAQEAKEKGNLALAGAQYDEAVIMYSIGIALDPVPSLPSRLARPLTLLSSEESRSVQ